MRGSEVYCMCKLFIHHDFGLGLEVIWSDHISELMYVIFFE